MILENKLKSIHILVLLEACIKNKKNKTSEQILIEKNAKMQLKIFFNVIITPS